MGLELSGALTLTIWLCLFFFRGGFWRTRGAVLLPASEPSTSGGSEPPRVVVVVPARNEAEGVATAVHSLLTQHYSGFLHVVLIDDNSTDRTENFARQAAADCGAAHRLTVIPGQPLPPGWTGKLWAVRQGVAHALTLQPGFLLFTDADIRHDPQNVATLVTKAESERLDLVSLMVRLRCESLAERALIPAFVYFFFQLYPPAWVANPRSSTAGAAGGCILLRPELLAKAGGIEAIRGELIDDCSLAARVKAAGGRLWLGLTDRTVSLRPYNTWGQVGQMVSRTAFTQLRYSWLLLAGTVLGLFLTYLLPPLLVLTGGWPAVLGGAAWLLMAATYLPLVRFYGLSPLWSLALPTIALYYTGATVQSALLHAQGRGGAWKGRVA